MGNFGKRILFVLLAVALVVALAVVGNAFQQRNKDHAVSKAKTVVYSGSYEGLNYSITKADVWTNIIHSSPLSTINEMLDKELLKNVINSIDDEDEINKKINYLIYSTGDADEIAEIEEDAERDAELNNAFQMRMAILGYYEDGQAGQSWKDYAKLAIARDLYARYRIVNGLSIGSYTFDLSSEKLQEEIEDTYKDTYALTIKFYSQDDATSFLKEHKLVTIDSRLRYYVGDRANEIEKNESGSYYLNDDLTLPELTVRVLHADSSITYEKVPYGNVEKDEDGFYVWDNNNDHWTYTGGAFEAAAVDIWDETSFTNDNTAYLSDAQLLKIYVALYNDYYSQQRAALKTTVSLDDFASAYGFTKSEGLYSEANVATLNNVLKAYDLVIVNNNGTQEIRKYVGNEEYVVSTDDEGKAIGENGLPTYKKDETNEENIPNYKIQLDEEGKPVLDVDNKFIYYLDGNGEKVANDGKKEINDQTTFDLSNTIAASDLQLFLAFYSLNLDVKDVEWANPYKEAIEAASSILYNYDKLSAKRSSLAAQIFSTMSYNTSKAASIIASPTSYTGSSSSETPYYLIYKLTDSTKGEASETELNEFKEEKIDEYLKTSGLVNVAMAELKKDSALQLFDEYLGWDYEALLEKDTDSNPAGINHDDLESYYKVKSYNNKKLLTLKTPQYVSMDGDTLKVEGTKTKYTIKADDLYEYVISQNGATYIANATLSKLLLSLKEFEEIHGKESNYLTSKNWKMKQYAELTQNYNYYYEYYKQMYAQYGLTFYDTVEEFLYANGVRNFDDLVLSLMRGTMRNLYLYKAIVGEFKEITDLNTFDLTAYGNELFGSQDFKELYTNYFDVKVSHVLFYIDLDEDGNPDDYKDFLKTFDETTGESSVLKDNLGNPLTLDQWNTALKTLEQKLLDKIYDDDTFSASNQTLLSTFVTDYNNSSRHEDLEMAGYKKLGIMIMNETLGEVTSSSVDSYVEEFRVAVRSLHERLQKSDNKVQGYTLSDSLTATEFGEHFLVETAGTNFDKPTFKFTDSTNSYALGCENDTDELTKAQFALYILRYVYTQIYGDTADTQENAAFSFPNMPDELVSTIELYYGDWMALMLDQSNTYHSNYINLLSLSDSESSYKAIFTELKDIYHYVLFEA